MKVQTDLKAGFLSLKLGLKLNIGLSGGCHNDCNDPCRSYDPCAPKC